jgi:hypothetical protein
MGPYLRLARGAKAVPELVFRARLLMFHKRLADNINQRSVAARLQRQRLRILLDLIRDSSGPVRILEIGGTPASRINGAWQTKCDASGGGTTSKHRIAISRSSRISCFRFFQFLPVAVRVWPMQHFNLDWYARIRDRSAAMRAVTSIRLLSRDEVQQLFPDAQIFERSSAAW